VTVDASLTARFEAARPQLGAVAYRILGSIDDAQDAVQEAWLRLSGSAEAAGDGIANLDAWLTTVVARICLNTLRDRHARHRGEVVAHLPDPIVDPVGDSDPEHRAMLADAVGLALFVVLDTRCVCRPVRPDRTHRRPNAGGDPQAGQPRTSAH
jgi:RNA polymerase sigma-70 factor (ECF subfamily)